jgi:hypothetical protein
MVLPLEPTEVPGVYRSGRAWPRSSSETESTSCPKFGYRRQGSTTVISARQATCGPLQGGDALYRE